MSPPKELTRVEVLRAAARLRWTRKLPKWTVVVNDRELPARPLVLEAAGVPPNDPINSHQAVAILKNLGFETRYTAERREVRRETEEAVDSARDGDLMTVAEILSEIIKDVPEGDWRQVPDDLSKNVDHYLYGSKKSSE